MLLRGRRFWYAVGKMAVIAVASCVLPAVWYIAAYQQGGEEFFNLVMEENFGRFMGKMSYESHVHGMHYNFITVLSGYVPYTLLLVMALPWAIRRLRAWQRPKHWWQSIKRIQGRLDWNPTFLYLLEEPFTVYEATELVNLINPGRPIVSNNFLVKFGEFVEEVGVKRVPKKKPRKTYRLKQ